MTSNTDFEELARLGVATVYEARGRKGLVDHEWKQLIPNSSAAGPARTALCGHGDNRAVHEAVAHLQKGEILVLTMEEPEAFGIIGDLLVTQMIQAGAAGVLVNAGVRDSKDLAQMGLPVWTRWIRARGASKEIRGAVNIPVNIGGTVIHPGDTVILDNDGVVVVPQLEVREAVELALAREKKESIAREQYLAGALSYDQHGFRQQDMNTDKES